MEVKVGRKSAGNQKPLSTLRTKPAHIHSRLSLSGGNAGGATPDPISNSEVKPSRADGTARETVWESRSSPGFSFLVSEN